MKRCGIAISHDEKRAGVESAKREVKARFEEVEGRRGGRGT